MTRSVRVRTVPLPVVAFALTVAVCTSAGCALGPDYTRPTVDVPQAYRYASEVAPTSTLVELPESPQPGQTRSRTSGGSSPLRGT